MFSKEPRCHYENHQVGQVICQLRFPEILTIGVNVPVEFQEAIRADFPRYVLRQETPGRVPGAPVDPRVKSTPNYNFVSADGMWRVNLTSKFISLSTGRYEGWEDFARRLDKPLASFISIYKPAFFERVGLRYVNFISRKALELEGVPFRELIHSRYLGILDDEEIPDGAVGQSKVEAELALRGGCRARINAGPGLVKRGNVNDGEIKFIFDQDLYMSGNVPVNHSAGALQTLHSQAFAIFRDAITDKLHEAMEPDR